MNAIERQYHEISQPAPAQAKQIQEQPLGEKPQPALTRADVNAVIAHKRPATLAELNWIFENAKVLKLASWEKDQLGVLQTILVAERMHPSKPEDANAQLFASLGIAITKAGLLYEPEWFLAELRNGLQSIANCINHRPPRCQCWRESRDRLYGIRERYSEQSPESLVSMRIWEQLEEAEITPRPNLAQQ